MKRKLFLGLIVLVLSVSLSAVATGARTQSHLVQTGDTLWKIARKYDADILTLLDLNPGITPDNLSVGQQINLLEPLYSYHVIQRGDNVRSLAAQYEIPLQALLEVNGIKDEKIVIGEMIRIPMHLYQGDQKAVTHLVEIGDTLFKLARQYRVSLNELARWNNIDDLNQIFAGQTLIVR